MEATLSVNENGVQIFISDTGAVCLTYALDSETDIEREFKSIAEAEKQYGKRLSEIDMFDVMGC